MLSIFSITTESLIAKKTILKLKLNFIHCLQIGQLFPFILIKIAQSLQAYECLHGKKIVFFLFVQQISHSLFSEVKPNISCMSNHVLFTFNFWKKMF